MNNQTENVAVFVDASSIWHDVLVWSRKNHNSFVKVDYGKLLKLVVRGRHCVASLAIISPANLRDLTPFANALMHIGYGVRWADQQRIPELVHSEAQSANTADVICLVSSQGNYCEALVPFLRRGKRVEVYNFSFDESSLVLPTKEFPITAVRLDESVLMGHF